MWRSHAPCPAPRGADRHLPLRRGGVRALLLLIAALVAAPATAWAHGDGETQEGYLLVQQALGHLAHSSSAKTIDLAMEKVNDALETEDQEGVDVPEVEAGMKALEAGDADQARGLLQDSIKQALHDQAPAMGNETGTTVVSKELPGRSGIDGQGWGFLGASSVALVIGLGLARRFRPHDTVRVLRRTLAHVGTGDEPAGTEDGRED